jgi:carbon-monoxide dehydrogenase large subunit
MSASRCGGARIAGSSPARAVCRRHPGAGWQLLTGSPLDYAVPRADVLPAIRSHFQETPSPTNPLGAKGIGESGTIGAPPTIVHAVLDALAPFGIAHLDMPLIPPKIWASIQAAGADAKQ